MQESARIHVRKLGPPSSPGESVPAVRRNCDKDVEVSESVGTLPFSEESKPRRADPCTAKRNSNMQQLTLQFDGFAPIGQSVDAPAAKEQKATVMSWLNQESSFFSSIAGESVSRLNAICGAVAVVSGFLFISFAALIGG